MPYRNDGVTDPIPQLTYNGITNQPEARQPSAESVISPYHPRNDRRGQHEGNGNYIYRQRNIKLNFTLGWELEANHVPTRIPSGVEHISDGSVDGDGAEFVVLPAITKSPRYVLALLKDLVHAPKLNTNKSCGFHVHISASNLASVARMRQWAIATEHLALQVEDLAFKAVPDARQGNNYCRRIVPLAHGTAFNASKYNNNRRYHWLNIVEMFRPNGIRTIEVRLLGNTHRWKYLLAWSLFSMELARRGWELSNKPFDLAIHVDALGHLLKNIAKDIRPLEKRHEPIPQWVYDGLKTFNIEPNAWERPLARLTETEADISGNMRRYYSDNQPEIPSRCEDDEDDNSCGCGCGEDGSCEQYTHDNGDCDSSYCYPCHSNGDCGGLPRCERCIDDAHDAGEDCTRSRCGTCHPVPRVRVDSSGTVTGRISNGSPTGLPPSEPISMETMQRAVNHLRNLATDNVNMQVSAAAYDATLYGSGIATVYYDESVNVGTNVLPTVPEELALPMTDAERLSSDARERMAPRQSGRASTIAEIDGRIWVTGVTGNFYQPPASDGVELERRAGEMLDLHEIALSVDREHTRPRPLTVAEIERFNRNNEARLRGNR